MSRRGRVHPTDAKERLLAAAQAVFAGVGYRRATIREICRLANLTVAMINYHFGGKASLYRTVLEHALGQSMGTVVPSSADGPSVCPEERLYGFVFGELSHALAERGPCPKEQLVARELEDPSFALSTVVDLVIRPRADQGHTLVRELVGNYATDCEVHRIEQSIVAQCLHYRHIRPILDRLYPDQTYGPEDVSKLARHITRFSLAAITAFRQHTTPEAEGQQPAETPPAVFHQPENRLSRDPSEPDDVQRRLLQAALELFALKGFRHVTIREICQRASANIAMVNYYFGTKDNLYEAVLQHALRGIAPPPQSAQPVDRSDRDRQLQGFVLSLLSDQLDEERSPWIKRLITHEMDEPTFALDALVNRIIRPQANKIHAVVRSYLESGATDSDVRWHAESIVAQCLYYHYSRPVVELLFPAMSCGPQDVAALAAHINRFSLAALRAFRPAHVH